MTDAAVRPALPTDLEAMLAIYRPIVTETAISFETSPPGIEELGRRLNAVTVHDPWLVADVLGDVVGYAYAAPFKARPAYASTRETTVYVHRDHRSTGLGSMLLGSVLDLLAARGDHRAVAFITLPNAPSVALHERLGYSHIGTLQEVGRKFDRWHDVGIWELDITRR